jgi:hypothetical protein
MSRCAARRREVFEWSSFVAGLVFAVPVIAVVTFIAVRSDPLWFLPPIATLCGLFFVIRYTETRALGLGLLCGSFVWPTIAISTVAIICGGMGF